MKRQAPIHSKEVIKMNRSFIIELTDEENELLFKEFNPGRTFDFEAPAMSFGFSLTALLANWFERLGWCESVPIFVREKVGYIHKHLIESAMILPYAIRLPYPPVSYIEEKGTAVFAKGIDKRRRIAILFSEDRFWVVAMWDKLTGDMMPLPDIGKKIYLPIKYNKEQVLKDIEKARQKAELKLKNKSR